MLQSSNLGVAVEALNSFIRKYMAEYLSAKLLVISHMAQRYAGGATPASKAAPAGNGTSPLPRRLCRQPFWLQDLEKGKTANPSALKILQKWGVGGVSPMSASMKVRRCPTFAPMLFGANVGIRISRYPSFWKNRMMLSIPR